MSTTIVPGVANVPRLAVGSEQWDNGLDPYLVNSQKVHLPRLAKPWGQVYGLVEYGVDTYCTWNTVPKNSV